MSDDLGDQLVDGASELLDFAFDQIIGDEFLKELPFIGLAVRLAKAGMSVRDRLFLKKVQLFLLALSKVDDEKRARFQEQLEDDKAFRDRVGETLLLIIERLDSMKKPEMLAKVFAYFMKGKIKEQEFRRLASAIDLAFVDDLTILSRGPVISDDTLWSLVRSGLAEISSTAREHQVVSMFENKLIYHIRVEISKLGDLFMNAMRD